MSRVRLSGLLVLLTLATVPLVADTLIMRDGRRVSGTLVSVRNDTIEFDESRLRQQPPPATGPPRRRARRVRRWLVGWRRQRRPTPGGLRERTVIVQARHSGPTRASTFGADSKSTLDANGEIRWGTGGRKDGPEGEKTRPVNQTRPIPNRPAGALIGRVGDDDSPFFAGNDRGPYRDAWTPADSILASTTTTCRTTPVPSAWSSRTEPPCISSLPTSSSCCGKPSASSPRPRSARTCANGTRRSSFPASCCRSWPTWA